MENSIDREINGRYAFKDFLFFAFFCCYSLVKFEVSFVSEILDFFLGYENIDNSNYKII